MKYRVVTLTDAGILGGVNQDSIGVCVGKQADSSAFFCVVCDGMGGLSNGELASSTVMREFKEWFYEYYEPGMTVDWQDLQEEWLQKVTELNDRIMNYGIERGIMLGTTIALLFLDENHYYSMNVGDSRVYQAKENLSLITKDHSLVQSEYDCGMLSVDEMKKDSRRNVLLQCVGVDGRIKPDFYTGEIENGMAFLVCSDGFWHEMKEDELFQFLHNPNNYEKERLRNCFERNMYRGEQDNMTACAVYCEVE